MSLIRRLAGKKTVCRVVTRGQPPRQIREQVPAAFVEAAEAFRTRAAAAALEHSIVLRSCDEDAGKGAWAVAAGSRCKLGVEVTMACRFRS